MKKSLILIATLLLFFSFPEAVRAEVITDFDVSYTINQDGTVAVKETIVYDFEGEQRRGIFRTIKYAHPQAASGWLKTREVLIIVEGVKKNDIPESFEVIEYGSELEIRIGNPDVYISDTHSYEISYTLMGALSSGPDGAEFYWNVTGNDWPVAINQVGVVTNSGLEGVIAGEAACYVGGVGSTDTCLEILKNPFSVLFKSAPLQPGEGLTIAVELDPILVTVVSLEETTYVLLGVIVALLWLVYFGWSVYRYRTQDRTDRPVIAQYEPYEHYLPMYTGVLLDGRLDPADISAGLMYLAEQGFLKIKRIETKSLLIFKSTDYEITLLRPLREAPTDFLKTLSGLLFPLDANVPASVLLSSLEKNQTANAALILSLQSSLTKDLKATGIMTNTLPRWTLGKTILTIVLTLMGGWFLIFENDILVILIAGVGSLIIGLYAQADRRTAKGYEIKNHLQGFKLFLSVTDKERFDFHNAPETNPELFMKYLPYAVALGVEEKWAKVFEGITIPAPAWYDGNGVTAFSAVAFTQDFGNFSTNFSSSSGTAGSSGGGSSGGGGGGGGGGSW